MSENKRYTLVVRRKRVEVSREVYKAYYIAYERERYAKNKAKKLERSLERFTEDGVNAEYQYAKSRPSLEDQFLHRQTLEKLPEALDALSKTERMLIDELFFRGKSCRKIALEAGIPQRTLNNHKNKILQKLKKILEN